MNRRQLIGLDLNGVNDRLAVSEESGGLPQCVDLGVRGSLVHLLTQERWVAGRQNEAAPHGRGPAWGEIGDARHRVELLALFERLRTAEVGEREADAFASALAGLTAGGERVVLAVPDIPDWGEAFRDRYLRLLIRARTSRPLLLWRPVAVVLGWLAGRPAGVDDEVDDDRTVAVLSLMADGVHLAPLTLEGVVASLPVPVRRRTGVAGGASFRGERLIEAAHQCFIEKSGLPEDDIRASVLASWRFAIGTEPAPELLRLSPSRGWKLLPKLLGRPPAPDVGDLPEEALRLLGEADLLLVEGPFAGNAAWRDSVLEILGQRIDLPVRIECLAASTVALGCLEAARRDREGKPIYFDFLPQLEINALVEGSPQFVDLIARGERCQGGQVFRAPAPDRYAINRGASRFAFWLFKEDFEHGRKAEAPLPETADRRYALTIEVSQTPGQGYAEVTISSPEFAALRRRPIHLNWAEMQKVSETREQILDEVSEHSRGLSWPEAAVKPGHPIHWSEKIPDGDLLALLRAYRQTPLVKKGIIHAPTKELLKKLRERFRRPQSPGFLGQKLGLNVKEWKSRHALNSDGTLPTPVDGMAVPEDAEGELELTLGKLEQDMAALQCAFDPEEIERELLGDVIGFASWCFWICPPSIAELLLDIYGSRTRYKLHHSLLREGVARVAGDRDRLKRYFAAVERRLETVSALTAAEFAGLARALGTAPEAAAMLERKLADHLLEQACRELENENSKPQKDAYKRRFNSAVLMLTALLRHRQRHRDFLDPEIREGKQMLSLLEKTEKRNLRFAGQHHAARPNRHPVAERMKRNANILNEIQKFIRLEGSDPNLIEQIQAIPDD